MLTARNQGRGGTARRRNDAPKAAAWHPAWRQGLIVGVVCLLLGGVGSAVMLRLERARLASEAGGRLAEFAGLMSERLNGSLASWAQDVGLLATFDTFEREPPEPASARRLLENLRNRSPTFSWIGFAGADGKVIAATGGLLEGQDVSARPWFPGGLRGLYLGDVHPAVLLSRLLPLEQGGGADAYFVDAAAPVKADDGRVLGVIAGHLTWRWADGVAAEMARVSPWNPPPALHILSADGQVLYGPPGERGGRWNAPRQASGWAEEEARILGFGQAPEGRNLPHLGWTVVASRDREAILAPLPDMAERMALGVVLISAVAGGLAGLRARRSDAALRRIIGGGKDEAVEHRIEALRDQAWRDPLTGLLNRGGFAAWRAAHPAAETDCAVVALDLDGFKPINDRHGHAAGDAVLQGIGRWLQQNIRATDAAIRTGGDEFLLVLGSAGTQGEAAALEVATRLNLALEAGIHTPEGRLSLGCSFGVVLVPRDAPNLETALGAADAALYETKRRRKTAALR